MFYHFAEFGFDYSKWQNANGKWGKDDGGNAPYGIANVSNENYKMQVKKRPEAWLAEDTWRTKTFHNKKIYITSTPTLKTGHIWKEKENADIEKGIIINAKKEMKLGVGNIPEILLDNTDRNRTSPFAFRSAMVSPCWFNTKYPV